MMSTHMYMSFWIPYFFKEGFLVYAFIAIYIGIYFERVLQYTWIDSWRSEETQMVPSTMVFCCFIVYHKYSLF